MKFKEHPVEKFDDNKIHHSAHWITEVTDDSEIDENEHMVGFTKKGFYFCDESEAYLYGPFDTFDEAVENRNEYFKQL